MKGPAALAYGAPVDPAERLRSAAESGRLVDGDGHPVRLDLRPGLEPREVAGIQSQFAVPLPRELTRLLACTSGTEALLDLDLSGDRHSIEAAAELLPAGLPVAADGFGNFWLLDLTPDTVDVAPVFYLSHDAPVLLHQADSLADFLDEAVKTLEPPHASRVEDVHEDRLHQVWRTRPGALTWQQAMSSGDGALRDFAETLDPTWTVVDLRHREVGMGLAWGAHGPRTRLARHGWERIFGYAPPAPRRRWWHRAAFADPTMGQHRVRSRPRGRRTSPGGAPPP
jgi:hypothetical protein